jgi:hypothetical protein
MLRPKFIGIAFVLTAASAPAEADMCFHYKVSLGGTLGGRGVERPRAIWDSTG